jgi:hypothetical protein
MAKTRGALSQGGSQKQNARRNIGVNLSQNPDRHDRDFSHNVNVPESRTLSLPTNGEKRKTANTVSIDLFASTSNDEPEHMPLQVLSASQYNVQK